MRRILASAAALALIAGTASTAVAKDHLAPVGNHVFGQDRADESYVIGGETAKVDATGTVNGVKFAGDKGIDTDISTAAQSVDREPAMPKGAKPRN
jgi:hypothetical protein